MSEHSRDPERIFGWPAGKIRLCVRPFNVDGGAIGGWAGTGSSGGSAPATGPGQAAGAAGASIGNLLPWLYPTADFLNLHKFGTVALPAVGATATVLSFTVANGRNGKITQMGIDFAPGTGAAFIQAALPAQLTFALTSDARGYAFPDYEAFNYAPGSVSAPTPINGLMIKEAQTITLKVTNNTIVIATQQFVAAVVLGYLYSKSLEPKLLSYQ